MKSDRIGFFFGAGASTNFGLPTMKTMTIKFTKKLKMETTISISYILIYIRNWNGYMEKIT